MNRLISIVLALNLAAAGLTAFKLRTPSVEAAVPEPKIAPTNEVTGPVKTLEPFMVNLDEEGAPRYLRVVLQMELASADADEAIDHSMHIVRDSILRYLSGLHVADTLGAEAKDKIRGEILSRIERIAGGHKIRRLFFEEIVVQ
jgi:flagellar FliL protein